jgi:hypothetical protein
MSWWLLNDGVEVHAWPRLNGAVAFSVKAIGDGPLRKTPRRNAFTRFAPSPMLSRLSQGHRCLPSRDAPQMIPQHTFTENGTDPTRYTLVGNSADSPEPRLRRLPATGPDAEILDVYDLPLGFDAETCPYLLPQQTMRPTSRAGLWGGCGETMPTASPVRRLVRKALKGKELLWASCTIASH